MRRREAYLRAVCRGSILRRTRPGNLTGSKGVQTPLGSRDNGRFSSLRYVERNRGITQRMRCTHCDADFTSRHVHRRFCSAKCRAAACLTKPFDLTDLLAVVKSALQGMDHRGEINGG